MSKKKSDTAPESAAVSRAQKKLAEQLKKEKELFKKSAVQSTLAKLEKLELRHAGEKTALKNRSIVTSPKSHYVLHLFEKLDDHQLVKEPSLPANQENQE